MFYFSLFYFGQTNSEVSLAICLELIMMKKNKQEIFLFVIQIIAEVFHFVNVFRNLNFTSY